MHCGEGEVSGIWGGINKSCMFKTKTVDRLIHSTKAIVSTGMESEMVSWLHDAF